VIERSFDPDLMRRALTLYSKPSHGIDCDAWVKDQRYYLLHDGEDVGLGTFEYPGVYTVHWFFHSRGKAAIKQARAMLDWMFANTDCKAVRGLTPQDFKAARWLAKQVGLKSYGFMEDTNGVHELMIITKEEFYGNR
jgi:hypothetical protein